MCFKAGRNVPATVCDHIEPHCGDEEKFWSGPFQSLYDHEPWRCHSSKKQQIERIGYSTEVGADGLPTDPHHPWTRG
jgi:5-methylcytosine-specific restriction enzyme A